MIPQPKTYVDEMEKQEAKRKALKAAETTSSLYAPKTSSTSGVDMQRAQMQKMTLNQEEKMGTFIDEMRQNFISQQSANQVPQSLIMRQTQMMDRQIDVLENNQKQIGEIINNMMNKGASGAESSSNIKQNVFNENRRMMLEMMHPVNN